MIAIGVDPGTRACGFAMLWREAANRPWIAQYVLTVRPDAALPLHERLRAIWDRLHLAERDSVGRWSARYLLDGLVVAVEDQTGAAEGHRRRGTTNADAVLVHQVVGVVRAFAYSLANYGPVFIEVTPQEAKRVLLGIKGTATKAQVQRAVRAIVKNCPKVMSEHASDAVAIALAGARRVR